jgi:hypothetical protein
MHRTILFGLSLGLVVACFPQKDLSLGSQGTVLPGDTGGDVDGEGLPVAVAAFRAYDPDNPSAPFTEPAHIAPLVRLYFDGRGSYDPKDPSDPSLIAGYQWEVVEYPVGTNPEDFQPQGQSSALFSFWVPLAGEYRVRLTVVNTDGVSSLATDQAFVSADVVPCCLGGLHLQLVWDHPSNDVDLHLVNHGLDPRLCNPDSDCFFQNRTPIWFGTAAAGTGPNPHMDIDDIEGFGPENINIDSVEAGTYRVYVHYFGGGPGVTRATLRMYANALQVAEFRRSLESEQDIWWVAEIVVQPDHTIGVQPAPADIDGEIGAVSSMSATDCTEPGWEFVP